MGQTDFLSIILAFFPWGFVKLAVLILIFLYSIFAFVIVRQEMLMSKVVEVPFFPILRLIAVSHLVVSFVVFVLALVLL